MEELPEVEAVPVDEVEVEDVEDLEEEVVEVPEEVARKLSSNRIVMGACSSPRVRKTSLSRRTWCPVTPFMGRRKLRFISYFRSKS